MEIGILDIAFKHHDHYKPASVGLHPFFLSFLFSFSHVLPGGRWIHLYPSTLLVYTHSWLGWYKRPEHLPRLYRRARHLDAWLGFYHGAQMLVTSLGLYQRAALLGPQDQTVQLVTQRRYIIMYPGGTIASSEPDC